MTLSPTLSRPTKSLLAAVFLVAVAAMAIGWTAGTVAASSGSQAASSTVASKAAGANVPGLGTTTTLPQYAGGSSSSGTTSSIAYAVPGSNSLGAAPEGTILAEGTGTADMKADGSDRATALKKATDAALADAHDQALAVAASVGVQLDGIYSVSIASNTSYTYPTPDCLIVPLQPGLDGGAAGSAGSVPVPSPAICSQLNASTPTAAQLVVTLIVVYKYA
jgi:hypothetical protein